MSDQPEQKEPNNILEQEPPSVENFVERVRFFAKALAYGAMHNVWTPTLTVTSGFDFGISFGLGGSWSSPGGEKYTNTIKQYLKSVWEDQHPHASFLLAFGYFEVIELRERKSDSQSLLSSDSIIRVYALTPKAFALLEEPETPPSVFISYRRITSSALGLLIVSRLQARGVSNPFIDMNIDPGDLWHAQLEEKVRESQCFISLISPETLQSDYVVKEIEWALDQHKKDQGYQIIPVWHSGFHENPIYPEKIKTLDKHNAIRIVEESASAYDEAIVKLLNKLGYAPR